MSRFHTTDFDLLPERAFRPTGRRMTLEGGGKGSSAPPPDPRLIERQIKSMDVQDAAITRMLDNADTLLPFQREQMQFGLQTARTAYEQSQADRNWLLGRRDTLGRLQDSMISDAEAFDTDARRAQLAGEAATDVSNAFATARGASARGLTRMGVNPGAGAYAAMTRQSETAEAVAKATAMNKVRQAARMEGIALKDRATNSLAGYPAMGMQATGAGAGYGASGLALANSGLAGMNSGYGAAGQLAGQMGSNATGMYGAMGSYKNGQDQIAASSDPWNTMLGAAAGTATRWGMGKIQ